VWEKYIEELIEKLKDERNYIFGIWHTHSQHVHLFTLLYHLTRENKNLPCYKKEAFVFLLLYCVRSYVMQRIWA